MATRCRPKEWKEADVPDPDDWNRGVIDEFRANAGQVGGYFEGTTMLLLHSTGARSGEERVNPLLYLPHEQGFVVFATAGASPTNPGWYHNLVANPAARVEVGIETIPVRARITTGAERDALYAEQVRRRPSFAEYEQQTTRVIPVVVLERTDQGGIEARAPMGAGTR